MSAVSRIEPQTLQAEQVVGRGASVEPSDWGTLAPWYVAELMNCFGCTLFTSGSYLYATKGLGTLPADRLWWIAAGLYRRRAE